MYEQKGAFRKGLDVLQEYKKDKNESNESAFSKICNEIDLEENTNPGYVFAKKILNWVGRDKAEKGNAISSSIVLEAIERIAQELFDELNDFKEGERKYFLPTEAIAFYFMFVKFAELHLDYKRAMGLKNYENPFDYLRNQLYKTVVGYSPENIKMLSTKVMNFEDISDLKHTSSKKSSMVIMDAILDEIINNAEYPSKWDSDKKRETNRDYIESQDELREKLKSPSEYLNKCKRKYR